MDQIKKQIVNAINNGNLIWRSVKSISEELCLNENIIKKALLELYKSEIVLSAEEITMTDIFTTIEKYNSKNVEK